MRNVLLSVLEQTKKIGIKLNMKKCLFIVHIVPFLGNTFSSTEIFIDKDKMKANQELK